MGGFPRAPSSSSRNLVRSRPSNSMQLHSSANRNGSVPAATSLFVFVLVCALLAFALIV